MNAPEQLNASDTNEALLYGLDDRPRPWIAFLAALQHLLAIIVPIVTPGLLICQAIGVSPRDTNIIVSMSLVISGIATFLQCKRFGPLGAGLLIVQGTSFNFVGPLIAGGVLMVKQGTPVEGVMAAIFGVVIAGSFIEMGVSRVLPFIKRLITPLVTGIVVLMIGLTLIKVGLISMGGGYAAMGDGSFASRENLLLSGVVLAAIVVLNRLPMQWMRSCAIIIALAIGYALAAYLGRLDFTGMREAELFEVPMPLHFGLGFSWSLFIPMVVIYLVTSLEAIGDITATSKLSRQPVEGPLWMQRIKGGVLVNGANSLLAGFFNTFPSSVFAQNNGIIQLTGIASRYVGMWIAVMLVILGLFPPVAGVLQAVPEPVLGGAALVMFGAVAAAGINILAGIKLDRRALLIISVSLALGLGFSQVPEFLTNLPVALRNVLESGVATGGICALVMNWFLPESPASAEQDPV
ncbi:MAG: uracil-xanthine permease family protein [Gammaproteobacteria bacterium]|uniref:uracil-xanthine permease family protein n=1 Tax=Stutzerimonas xanthomarina TaxID=271420 RepID=UPI00190D36A3|nr:uracil-xanthine permease family protein [Stutzerimonas xanthomarina]MBU0812442.1 uracil-xanthine permease family protein [Gammaproteobacteria bacterium]MBK3849316.1 xanthine permease XanP [Stutzerimonas xanthomarina]MBU0838583.1 uracil-xanthine permease family protein [Gammaproteobacteria bacterium]MBU1303638.1 uracil-xanthine permease family protein [Gammaproteobacteria bacterium]MBU1458167.1 uracil-xanthine permease family protein [Gammaproteobacteria bacterium]